MCVREQFGGTTVITDEELMSLPEDPEEKFAQIVKLAGIRLGQLIDDAAPDVSTYRLELEYVSMVLGAARECDIEGLNRYSLPIQEEHITTTYRALKTEAEHICIQLRIRFASRIKRHSVRFDAATKQKLHHHLDLIRSTVSESDLPDAKKDRLYSRVSALGLEIDKDRTRMEAVAALITDAATASKPIIERVKEVAVIFGHAKQNEDSQASLPAPKVPKRIEHKPTRAKRGFDKQLDDEIPF